MIVKKTHQQRRHSPTSLTPTQAVHAQCALHRCHTTFFFLLIFAVILPWQQVGPGIDSGLGALMGDSSQSNSNEEKRELLHIIGNNSQYVPVVASHLYETQKLIRIFHIQYTMHLACLFVHIGFWLAIERENGNMYTVLRPSTIPLRKVSFSTRARTQSPCTVYQLNGAFPNSVKLWWMRC
jgi:hypothetical protein